MADTWHNAEVEGLRLESLLSNLKAIDAIFCILKCFKLRKKHTLERSTLSFMSFSEIKYTGSFILRKKNCFHYFEISVT